MKFNGPAWWRDPRRKKGEEVVRNKTKYGMDGMEKRESFVVIYTRTHAGWALYTFSIWEGRREGKKEQTISHLFQL